MIRRFALVFRSAAVVLALAFVVSCGDDPAPVVASPPITSTPAPAPTPTPVQGCPLGLGSPRYTCQGDVPGLLPRLNEAIDKLVQDQPELFDTVDDPSGLGAYRINNVDAFYDGVIANLNATGLCSQRDYLDNSRIVIKEDNTYSEAYDVVGRQTRILRPPQFVFTCTPANFPLNPGDAVARVSVSFFRYVDCPAGTVLPPPHDSLPVGCRGTITATPRDSLGNKLPPELHGADISWFVRQGEGTIIGAGPSADGVPFNLLLDGRQAGEFSVCAVVAGVTGCLNGHVLP